jgi:hypothetical protein
VGWYNGEGRPGGGVQPNWFYSKQQFSRVYDDFVVPAGGWVVLGVFSDNVIESATITRASWEVRRNMAPGEGGKKVASGIHAATQTRLPGTDRYRIQVDGLRVRLSPGRYWLSVAPVGRGGRWYIQSTDGRNAVGDPPGNNGGALATHTTFDVAFEDAGNLPFPMRFGKARDFSQGVLIGAGQGR